jgi:V8-like Glu-specific endopeptidase
MGSTAAPKASGSGGTTDSGGALREYPLDFSRPEVRAIWDILARSIYRPRDIEDVVLSTGLDPGMVDFSGTARLQWLSVLDRARAEERIAELLAVVREMRSSLVARLDELTGPVPVLEPGTGTPDELSEPDGAGWRGFGAERLIVAGTDTLLGIAFLSTGLRRSQSICRLKAVFGPGKSCFGTGALVGPGLLLTNHHVLHDWDHQDRSASAVEAWFGYEDDETGLSRQHAVVRCDAATITGERAHDWAVVRTCTAPPTGIPVLSLRGADAPRKDDYVFIIQHPDGGPKMIGLSHNLVRHVDDDILQYWTDTKSGSSGALVFNSQWQVVGLHHRWVPAPDGDGVACRNQGRRIGRVIEGMERHGLGVS